MPDKKSPAFSAGQVLKFDERSLITLEEGRQRGMNPPCIHSWRIEKVSGKSVNVCPFCGSEREL